MTTPRNIKPEPGAQDLARVAVAYHGIRLAGRASRYSAWFDGSGFLRDCERKDARRRCYPCTRAEIAEIQRGGWYAAQRVTF